MNRRHIALGIALLGLVALSFVVAANCIRLRNTERTRDEQVLHAVRIVRIPVLDKRSRIEGWTDGDCIVARPGGEWVCMPSLSPAYLVNLRTKESRPIKPISPFGKPPSRNPRASVDYGPCGDISPDGKWFLHYESRYSAGAKRRMHRWRIVRTDGSETRFLPSNGKYVSGDPFGTIQWLPDSECWMFDSSDSRSVLRIYDWTKPDAPPQRIRMPFPAIWQPTQDGQFYARQRDRQGEWTFTFVSSKPNADPSPRRIHLAVGSDFYSRGEDWSISRDGNWMMTGLSSTVPEGPDSQAPIGFRVCKLFLFSLKDGSSREITGLPTGIQQLALSPHGDTLLYWTNQGAFWIRIAPEPAKQTPPQEQLARQ